uniref:Cytochrome b n=1 Tax=Hoplopleura akanezumi TaxID=1511645 RepID=A0A075EC74_9NEOP|nr:cytochrome b [Hoplopleura akanezumi]
MNKNKLMLELSKQLVMIPIPSTISYMWGLGSVLGLCLGVQIVTGLFLAMHYQASVMLAFDSVVLMMNDMNWGWLIRLTHANVASVFFIMVYLHISRSLRYGGYMLIAPWCSGVMILLLLMGTAFMGYVLPWGQMSYWGATVITNLLGAIPYLGISVVEWVWGGFSVGDPTLVRLFSLHFLVPFVLGGLVLIHLMGLHITGSSNPLGVSENSDKVTFHPFFSVKDVLGFLLVIGMTMVIIFQAPFVFMDPDNFIPANPLSTPPHIQPEWYFLFAYAILRSIPNKFGGVLALLMSILILLWLPLSSGAVSLDKTNPLVKSVLAIQVICFILLTWLGAMPVEFPFIGLGRLVSLIYFITFIWWGWLVSPRF